jgi:hypothetical protein
LTRRPRVNCGAGLIYLLEFSFFLDFKHRASAIVPQAHARNGLAKHRIGS